MKKDAFESVFYGLLAALSIAFLLSCTPAPDLEGRWQEIGKKATLEFHRDGTFSAVDDMGMAVAGKYTLYERDNIRFDIKHQDASTEIIKGKITVRGDELILTSADEKEVMTYKRAK